MIDNKQSDFDRGKTGEGQDIEEDVPGWIKYPHLPSADEVQPFFWYDGHVPKLGWKSQGA